MQTETPDIERLHAEALALHRAGRLAEAERIYRQILGVDPNHFHSLHLLGVLYHQVGRHDVAVQLILAAIEREGRISGFHLNLGMAYQGLGRLTEAVACFRKAIELHPDYPDAYNNLGFVLPRLGLLEEARACINRALELKPDFAGAYYNLGAVLRNQRKWEQAASAYLKCIALQPNYPEAYANLGTVYVDTGQLDKAIDCYSTALALKPDYPEARAQLVAQLQAQCRWADLADHEGRVLDLIRAQRGDISPFLLFSLPSTAGDQRAYSEAYGRKYPALAAAKPMPHRGDGKIRLGYLSSDFRSHPLAHLIVEVIERHDRTHFDVIGYSVGPPDDSAVRRRLIAGFDRFEDMYPLSFEAAARQIERDDIDILIVLTGYSQYSRTEILTFRPAPVQVNFLGYPGTLGLAYVDYILADAVCIPPGQEGHYTEAVVRLPNSFQPSDTKREVAERTPTRAECGLPDRGFVFCCFNNSYKVTPAVYDVWMRLLTKVPGSVLWLLEANAGVRANLRAEAAARGVDPARLIFAPRLPNPEHLARHRLADLFVDTLPCNAHTTASDALWTGLPVVTCIGQTFSARVAASLLHGVGLPELVTDSLADYEALALRLARTPAKLRALKKKLHRQRTAAALFDIGRFTRDIEAAFSRMRDINRSGQPAQPFDVP